MVIVTMPIRAEDEGMDLSSSFLWEIQYKNQAVGALLGTVHIGSEKSFVSEEALALLDQSSHLVTEIQVLFPSLREEQMAYSQAVSVVFPPVIDTIEARFSEKVAQRIREELRKLGIIEQARQDQLSTELILMLMMMDIGEGYQTEFGVEKLLRNALIDQEIENIALEEIGESLQYYVEATAPISSWMMETWLNHQDLLQSLSQQIVESYEANDIKRFERLIDKMDSISLQSDDQPEMINHYYDILLYQRNNQWLEALVPLLKANVEQGDFHFIAVGALHLLADQGMIELLREAGFELIPVSY